MGTCDDAGTKPKAGAPSDAAVPPHAATPGRLRIVCTHREKVLDGGHGDHIADVLRLLLILEGDADHSTLVIECWATGVAGVDCRINLRW